MSRVASLLSRRLIQRCVVTPPASATVDGDGQPVPGWGAPRVAVRCRLTDLTDDELLDRRQAGATRYTDALIVARDAPIGIGDKVTAIEGYNWDAASWAVIDGGPFDIVDVQTRYSDRPEYQRLLLERTG